jgi:RNA polymerase sigma-70 factor, ECF subfamily
MMEKAAQAKTVLHCEVGMIEQHSHDQFMGLLLRHQGQLFGYIFAAVHNLHDAEELYQETSLILWRKFASFEPGSEFARWACRTAKYEILRFQRDRRRSPLCLSDKVLSELAEIHIARGDEAMQRHQEILAECVDELPPADHQIVDLCYGGQDNIKQVAAKLQRAPKTLYNAVSRIRRALFDCVRSKLTREHKG